MVAAMLYLITLMSALLFVFSGWQLLRERKRRIDRSKPIVGRDRG